LRADRRAVADLDMIDNAHLSRQGHVFSDPGAPSDPNLRGDYGLFTDHNVMADLHEIIDLGAAADYRAPERRPVHRSIGTDFHVVFYDHNANLWDFDTTFTLPGIAESVAADHHAGVQNNAIAKPAASADHNVGVKHTIFPHFAPLAKKNSGVNHRAPADLNAAAHIRVREDRYRFAEIGRRIDMSKTADRLTETGRVMKKS
jgi:hypothetical protein